MDSDGSHYESEKQQYLPYFYHGSSGVGGGHHEMATPPQYGLLVFNMDDHPNIDAHEPIMLITNAPNSTFICGSQGSGKSYTLATILETLICPSSRLERRAIRWLRWCSTTIWSRLDRWRKPPISHLSASKSTFSSRRAASTTCAQRITEHYRTLRTCRSSHSSCARAILASIA